MEELPFQSEQFYVLPLLRHKGCKLLSLGSMRASVAVTIARVFNTRTSLQVGKAKHEILLSSVKSVEPPSKIPKGGTLHVFEVKFSGKGSPWVISASSQVRDSIAMVLGFASPRSSAVACSVRFGGCI